MTQLVLLVVAAAWAAVLIPPMLRSRVDNRPNSSVSDFASQLSKLQSTATPPRGGVRAMGRPLAQSSSPLQRQAAGGRPGQSARQPSLRGGTATRQRPAAGRVQDSTSETQRYRTHGDPTGGQRRPAARDDRNATGQTRRPAQRPQQARRPEPVRAGDPNSMIKRRRMNILFILVVCTASTMFLAATTDSNVMLYLLALSFLSLCGYIYALAQIREREEAGWNNGWLEQH